MAERQRTGGTRASGRPSRVADSWAADAAGSADGSGSATSTSPSIQPMPPEPAFPWRDTATLATYRLLLLRGLSIDEAANLTAFLCGLPLEGQRWKLIELNRLLFLRRLAQTGAWGATDGTARPAL